MLPLYKKYWRTIFDIALIVFTVYLIMLLFSKLYHLAAPVFLSFIVFACIEPLAQFLHRRGMRKAFASAISVLLFAAVLIGVFLGLGVILAVQSMKLADDIPRYTMLIQDAFRQSSVFVQSQITSLPPSLTERLNEYFETITSMLGTWGASFLRWLIGFVGSSSTFIANFAVAVILAFFLSVEIDLWKVIARKKTPQTLKTAFDFFKNHVIKAIFSYLRAQFLLVSITFALIFTGLLILGTGNAFYIAILCALFDLLPLLGVPVILLPWAIYLLIVGQTGLGIGLIVLLVITMLVRQLAEPKIAGNSIGVTSAYLMLSFMIISLSIFGVSGLIMSPILLILIKELMQQGYLQRWIHLPKDEFQESPFPGPHSGGPTSS